MDTITPEFRRPRYASPVQGSETVGQTTDSTQPYCCEAVYADQVGYGTGDTPAEARANARSELTRRLTENKETT